MKKIFKDDGKLVIHKKTDPTAVIENVKALRQAEENKAFQNNWHLARIDKHVLEKWVKEAGLTFDDREAIRDLLKKKLLDSNNAAFRVREGTF